MQTYFTTLAAARMPGLAGSKAVSSLRRLVVPGSRGQALAVAWARGLRASGGGGFPRYWTLESAPSGRWLLVEGGTGP